MSPVSCLMELEPQKDNNHARLGVFSRLFRWVKKTFQRFMGWLGGFRLPAGWARGAAWGAGVLVVLSGVYIGYTSQSGFGRGLDALVGGVLGLLGYLMVLWIVPGIVRLLMKLPPLFWVALVAAVYIQEEIWGDRIWLNWLFIGLASGAVILLGAAIYTLRHEAWGGMLVRKRVLLVVMAILGVGALVILGVVLFSPGYPAYELPVQVVLGPTQLDAANPGEPGSYQVGTLTYGSGTDIRRPEYGAEADLITKTVNASPYVSYSGLAEKARTYFWGFDTAHVPLNGRVWYPEGEGTFPLVLVVHGNHSMTDYSDPGYAYLGELLASRGFIVVSVDENFFNGGLYGKSSGENDARAWVLLQHLEVWKEWHRNSFTPFYGKVDWENIALIGHSRGGEAVALAAYFNRLTHYPNNARIIWDFDFNIRSVVAIAPVDGQHKPADHLPELTDINYLVLQGSHDADLYFFDGIQQYQRVSFSDPDSDWFKASLYIYRANHGQFNTTWGERDGSAVWGQMLNTDALLNSEEQRQIAKVYISAFLEATLHDADAYVPMFADYRLAGEWLPQTGYINSYADGGTVLAADFEEDADVTTLSLMGGIASSSRLSSWGEQELRYRNGDRQENHVVRLGWSSTPANYTLKLPSEAVQAWEISAEDTLVMSLADERTPEEGLEGLDFSVVLFDRSGNQAKVQLSDVMPLMTQFPAEFSRMRLWNEDKYDAESEAVLQSYRIPLSLFVAENLFFDPSRVSRIMLVFDQSQSGKIYLDDVGFDLTP